MNDTSGTVSSHGNAERDVYAGAGEIPAHATARSVTLQPTNDPLWHSLRARLALVLSLALIALTLRSLVVRNVTASEPLGYYLLLPAVNLRYGDLVALCEPPSAHAFAVAHHFGAVRRDLPIRGCPESRVLIKEVWGLPGDAMRVTAAGVLRNGTLLPGSAPLPHLRDGTPLPTVSRSTVPRRAAWGGSEARKSFDSRYFGSASVIARAVRIPW